MKSVINKTIYTLLLGASLAIGTGCSKFLEEEDPSNLSPDSYYTIPEHADAAIASAYAQTRFIGGGAGIFVQNFSLPEVLSGTAKTETGQNSDLNNLIGLSYNGDNLLIGNWWNGCYSVIAQTNLILKKVPGITPMDETAKKQILGQARFLRAWAYFYLVRMYGDVPLLVEPIENLTDPQLYPSRTSQAEVYDQIVADLTEAENAGLPWMDATGKVSRGAVKTLLSKVYLTMAGFPLSKGASHYALAAAKSLDVITNSGYGLFATYNDLHTLAQENRIEHIFQLQYLGGVADNPYQGVLLPNFKGVSKYGTEIGSTVPTQQFFNSYEAGDKRTIDRQGFFYTSYYTEGSGALKALGSPYIYKHFDIVAHGTSGVEGTAVSSLNYPLIRYAEALLIYAEASNEVDAAPNTAAYNALKAIRDRAGLITPAQGSFTKDSFREAVWRERWHELAYEGIAWFDMLRLRKAYVEATNSFENFVGHKFADNNATLADKHLLLPLPAAEMRNNQNLTPNNPGY